MGETKPVPINTLKKGSYIVIEDAACKVVDVETSKSGKHGHAKIRLTAVGLLDDRKRVIIAPGNDNVYTPIIEKKNAQVLSVAGNTANVMDNVSYETFDLPIPEELQGQVKEGQQIMYWVIMDEKVMKQVSA